MNLLRLSFTAASHKIFRHKALLWNVNTMIRSFVTITGNSESEQVVTYNTLIGDMFKAEDLSRADRKATCTSLIESLCKHDRIDEAYRVLNQMIVSGFSPSFATMNDVLRGFLRIGETRKAFEIRNKINEQAGVDCWMYDDTHSLFYQGLSDEVTYTSLLNAYLDEGNWDNAIKLFYEMEHLPKLFYEMQMPHWSHFPYLPDSVIHSVFINGLDKKTRTTKIKKELLKFNYMMYELSDDKLNLEYHRILAENSCDDEFKILVELVEAFCIPGIDNVVDMFLNTNYKPDEIDDRIVYNLFIIIHCSLDNVDDAYNVYKEMLRSGFACHMFTVFALITTLKEENMVNELCWVIQNVLRSCNLNDSETVKFLNEFNPKEPGTEALFDVLAEKAKDGLFLKYSYAPANA